MATDETVVVFETFIDDPVTVDEEVFEMRINGFSLSEASSQRQQSVLAKFEGSELKSQWELHRLMSCVERQVLDQFRIFAVMEPYLRNPHPNPKFSTIQLSRGVYKAMIERYYSFDERLVRQIVGMRLSKRTRNHLESVRKVVSIPLQSCQRQFDNCRRVSRTMFDHKDADSQDFPQEMRDFHERRHQAPLESFESKIHHYYMLPAELAAKYAKITFMCRYQFKTLEKQLLRCSFAVFEEFAQILMDNWSTRFPETGDDLDQDFISMLKHLKQPLSDKRILEEYAAAMKREMKIDEDSDEIRAQKADLFTRFASIIRSLVSVGLRLTRTRDMRDIFIDLLEVCLHFHRSRASDDVCVRFIQQLATAFDSCDSLASTEWAKVWTRYLAAVSSICIRLFAHAKPEMKKGSYRTR